MPAQNDPVWFVDHVFDKARDAARRSVRKSAGEGAGSSLVVDVRDLKSDDESVTATPVHTLVVAFFTTDESGRDALAEAMVEAVRRVRGGGFEARFEEYHAEWRRADAERGKD